MQRVVGTVWVLFFLFLSAEAEAKKINLSDYEPQTLEPAEFLPSKEEVKKKKRKVAVTPIEIEGSKPSAQDRQMAKLLETKLEEIVRENGDLVNRKTSARILGYLRECERQGSCKARGQSRSLAEIVLVGDILTFDLRTTFEASRIAKVIGGGTTQVPPKCRAELSFNAQVRLVDLQFNRVLDVIDKSGRGSTTVEASSCKSAEGQIQTNLKSVSFDAVENLIRELRVPILNALAPNGYILEKRTGKKGSIFKVSLGELDGIESISNKMEIRTKRSVKNLLTDENDIEEYQIATAQKTNMVTSTSFWVHVKNKKEAEQIRLGDYVRVNIKGKGFKFKLPSFKR